MSLERLTRAYNLSRNTCNADRWTAEEWLRLADAYAACDYDYTPCQWQAWQINDLFEHGIIPTWDDNGPIAS